MPMSIDPQPAEFRMRIDGASVLVQRKCRVSGETFRVIVQKASFDRWRNGELIQNVWPDMDPDHREILMSGYTPAEWDRLWSEPSEE